MQQITSAPFRQTLQHWSPVWSEVVEIYTTSDTREGWKRHLVLFITCTTFSLLLSSLLLLYLLYALNYGLVVAGSIAGSCCVLGTLFLFLSRRARCFGVLFVISCGMKQSRNLLITAGTSIVVLRNFRNTLGNLTGLARSVVCNLQAKRLLIDTTPLENYVRMLEWVVRLIQKWFTDLLVEFDISLQVTPSVDSEKLKEKLLQAERSLDETAASIEAVVDTLSSVGQRVFPAFSLLLIGFLTKRHLQRYCGNTKYKNTFITARFLRFDEEQKAAGKSHVLPLTPDEERRYACVPSSRLTAREGKAMLKFSVPALTHALAWAAFIGLDALMYWFVRVIKTHLETLEPLNVPLLMNVKDDTSLLGVHISGEDKTRDFNYSVALFEKKCLPEPKLLLSPSLGPLALVLVALVVMGLGATKLTQLRLRVCERFFAEHAEERVEHLHARILRRKSKGKGVITEMGAMGSLVRKPEFWCPLLFQAWGDKDSTEEARVSHRGNQVRLGRDHL